MSYTESILAPGEAVLAYGSIHKWDIIVGGLIFVAALLLMIWSAFTAGYPLIDFIPQKLQGHIPPDIFNWLLLIVFYPLKWLGWAGMIWGAIRFFKAITLQLTTEISLTNRRLIIKTGLLRRQSVELPKARIESVQVSQGLIAQLLNFGTLSVRGTGGVSTTIKCLADPDSFRAEIVAMLDS